MTRNSTVDFIKGMAIIAMVLGHAGPGEYINRFIYLWHMAIFFMASGYFFSVEKVSNIAGLRTFITKRIIKLYFVYVFWSVLLMLCHNLFISLNIYTDNPDFLNYVQGEYSHLTPYWHTPRKFLGSIFWAFFMMSSPNGTFWFLKALLVSSVSYALISFCLSKLARKELYVQTCVAFALLLAGVYMPQFVFLHYLGGRVVFTAYALLHLGRLMKVTIPKFSTRNVNLLALCGGFILLLLLPLERFELAMNRFHSIPVLLLASLSGWFFLSGCSRLFERLKLQETITYIGIRSMPIMIFHFLAFKIVSSTGVLILGLPHFCIAAFPVYFHGLFWCMAYTCVGIVVPIVLFNGYANVNKMLPEKWNWK